MGSAWPRVPPYSDFPSVHETHAWNQALDSILTPIKPILVYPGLCTKANTNVAFF